jgi:hypothetical protein
MRKIVIFTAVILLCAFGNSSAGQFGAPQPIAKDGGSSMGLGYFYYQNKWEPNDAVNFKESKVTQQQVYLQFTAATKYIEGYLRVGGASVKVDEAFLSAATTGNPNYQGFKSEFDDSGKVFGTIGARGIFEINPNFGIGFFAQASLSDNYEDSTSGTYLGIPVTQELKYKTPWEIAGGIAFQGKIQNLIVYAGPYLYTAGSKVEATATLPTLGVRASADTSYQAKSNFGGVAGLRFNIGSGFSVEIEGQYSEEFSAGGIFSYSF